ncbi:DUF1501 domain-containing protein [bacterium]|nr:DUF1501 domain-containing protein [bacterium]
MPNALPFTRRRFLRAAAVGLGGGSLSGWLPYLAAQTPRPAKSVIVLWLNGGPSTIDLWDLKPGHANGGPFREVDTTAPGLRLGEHLPRLAMHGRDLAVVRSMTSREGDHARAMYFLRTGYVPQGALKYPAVGAVVAKELGSPGADLPPFVSIAPVRYAGQLGGGFLGPALDPLVVGDALAPQDGLVVPDLARARSVSDAAQAARLDLLAEGERGFAAGRPAPVAEAARAAADRAVRLMRPEAAAAFDLDGDRPATRDAYGRNLFGQGCLLARRLVERGVPFVEVTLDGWDTHQNNFEQVRGLCATLDAGFAALVSDLKDRGLLNSTLVVCQGEFGRTPRINATTGRDHWPASWAVGLAGGGLKTGGAVGRTTADGTAVADRPVTVPDLIATVARAVGIDPQKQNESNVGRPIRVADPAARPVEELL